MISNMKLRSTVKSEEDENHDNRLYQLEKTVNDILPLLASMTSEIKKLNDSKVYSPIGGEELKRIETVVPGLVQEIPLVNSHDRIKNLMGYVKLFSHYSSFFPTITVPVNFRRYDYLLKYIVDMEQRFAYHGVDPQYQVKMFLKTIEGSDVVTEFFRHNTLKMESNEHTVSSNDIESWEWSDFKSEFIRLFIDQGAIYNIIDKMTSWKVGTFKTIKKSIEEYETVIKFLREINLIKGGDTKLTRLYNEFKIHFIRTIDSHTHDEVIQHMEIHNTCETRLKVIHDLEYNQLVEILINIESKREISKSLYEGYNRGDKSSTEAGKGYTNPKIKWEDPQEKTDVAIASSLNTGWKKKSENIVSNCQEYYWTGKCGYGEKCSKLHEKMHKK